MVSRASNARKPREGCDPREPREQCRGAARAGRRSRQSSTIKSRKQAARAARAARGSSATEVTRGKVSHEEARERESDCMDCGDSNVIDVSDESVDDLLLMDDNLTGPKSEYQLPGKIAKKLCAHQVDGLKWHWSLHCAGKGGILGDDMGLGKTMQICGFLAGLFHSRLIRALVVVPKTLLSLWLKELSAVGLSEKTREYYGTCPKARQDGL